MDFITALKCKASEKGHDMHRDGPPPEPAAGLDDAALALAKAELGFNPPALLVEAYQKIGNGGFGPGYGLMGLGSGATDDMGATTDSLYKSFREPDPETPYWQWPEKLMPICHFGCAVYACVDCSTQNPEVVMWEPTLWDVESNQLPTEVMIRTNHDLKSWLGAWIDGVDLWRETFGDA